MPIVKHLPHSPWKFLPMLKGLQVVTFMTEWW